MGFFSDVWHATSPTAVANAVDTGSQALTPNWAPDLNLGSNAQNAIEHPASFSTGGLVGGSGGIAQFSNVGGAGVQNSSLQGGMSNPNNRYGVIAIAAYVGGSYLMSDGSVVAADGTTVAPAGSTTAAEATAAGATPLPASGMVGTGSTSAADASMMGVGGAGGGSTAGGGIGGALGGGTLGGGTGGSGWQLAGQLGAGYLAGQGAQNAANTQAQAGQAAIASQQQMLASQQAINQPYVSGGLQALQQLLTGTQPGGQFTQQFAMKDLPTASPYVAGESQAQQFATKEALAAMQSQMAVGGQGLSSNAIVGAGKLAGDIGSQYENQGYNQWLQSNQLNFNQALSAQDQAANIFQMNQNAAYVPLANLANLGQASATNQAANIGSAGTNIANLQTGIGNVQAAGQIGQANALGGAVSNVGQYMMSQNLSQ